MGRMFQDPVSEPELNDALLTERLYEDNEIYPDSGCQMNSVGNGPETFVMRPEASRGGPQQASGGIPTAVYRGYGAAPRGVYAPYPSRPVRQDLPAGAPQAAASPRNSPALTVIAVLLALILAGGAVFAVLYFKDRDDKGGASENAAATADDRDDEATADDPAEETTSDGQAAVPETTAPVPTAEPATDAPPATVPLTTVPATTVLSSQAEPVILTKGNTYAVANTTPSHAGLNLRAGPGSGYELVAVIPEGAVLLYTGEKSSGYLSVEYYGSGSKLTGWVLEQYIANDHSGGDVYYNGASSSDTGLPTAVIGYNTDDHAGLVLRAESTYYSEKLGVLPEETVLYLLGDSANGYTKVKTQSGVVGWVLEDYLVK